MTKKELVHVASENSVDCLVLCYFMNSGIQVKDMSTKALGYHKIVEENRKLFNMVQDLKGIITFSFFLLL